MDRQKVSPGTGTIPPDLVNERQDDGIELLPMAEFQYNNHIHSSTQQTPFFLDSG